MGVECCCETFPNVNVQSKEKFTLDNKTPTDCGREMGEPEILLQYFEKIK